ncbi:MAG: GntR family transcriptional regulator [Rhizobiaceae bacterium]|nr:GntR family transcriptional regulator [Rhizobiaceae bacterium]
MSDDSRVDDVPDLGDFDLQIPKRSATLRAMVEDKLRQAISAGRFRPGQRLIERELCEMIGVGRTSIREALRQLEAEGLITSHPHRGPSVSSISLEEAKQLYSVRALLESYSGQEFATKGSAEDIDRLESKVAKFALAADRFEADPNANTRRDLIEAKTSFYGCLMEGGRNVFVQQMLKLLHNRVTLLRITSMTQPGRLQHSVDEIRDILAAIKARDGQRAADACRVHIERAADTAIAYLAKVEEPTGGS